LNSLNKKRKYTEADLAAALDRSLEAAVDLGMSDVALIALISKRLYAKSPSNVVQLPVVPQRRMYNSDAGP
jgi:hypothetical protein